MAKIKNVKYTDVITISLKESEMIRVYYFGGDLYNQFLDGKLTGFTHIYDDPEERNKKAFEDALKGQAGELVLHFYLLGLKKGKDSYHKRRKRINLTPTIGDNGSDVDGYLIDVKTSAMNGNLYTYHLAVRNGEKKGQEYYVHALIRLREMTRTVLKINLTGWARKEEVPEEPNGIGKMKGSCVIKVANLHRMSTFPFPNLLLDNTLGYKKEKFNPKG